MCHAAQSYIEHKPALNILHVSSTYCILLVAVHALDLTLTHFALPETISFVSAGMICSGQILLRFS